MIFRHPFTMLLLSEHSSIPIVVHRLAPKGDSNGGRFVKIDEYEPFQDTADGRFSYRLYRLQEGQRSGATAPTPSPAGRSGQRQKNYHDGGQHDPGSWPAARPAAVVLPAMRMRGTISFVRSLPPER